MFVRCEIKQKNTLFFSGSAVVSNRFLVCCFLYFSLAHAPNFHRSDVDVMGATNAEKRRRTCVKTAYVRAYMGVTALWEHMQQQALGRKYMVTV